MRSGKVYVNNDFAGTLTETDEGEYIFEYDPLYFDGFDKNAVSLTLPKSKLNYHSKVLFPFFDGLIPEGWLLEIGFKNWKINPNDRMELLLHLCHDCIGNIKILSENENP